MRSGLRGFVQMAFGLMLACLLSLVAHHHVSGQTLNVTGASIGYGTDVGTALDLSGIWLPRFHEEAFERVPGRELGDYLGIPVNDAARRRADAYQGSWFTLPEWQCRPMQGDSIWRGPAVVRFTNEIDPNTRTLIAIHQEGSRSINRPIWMDGRPHPPEMAPHDWNGFSTGEWNGDVLTVTTTHVKEGYVERNGLPRSDLAKYRQHFLRYGDWMTVVTIVYDPVYLTEPFILTSEYERSPHDVVTPYPCTVVEEADRPKGEIPHWLPGTNPSSREFAERYGVPIDAARGGAETMYPDYRLKLRTAAGSSSSVR